VETILPATTEVSLEEFFEALLAGFAQAQQRGGSSSQDWTLAGRAVRLHCAGESLVPLVRPLEHAQAEGTVIPELTIYAWEGPADWVAPEFPWPGASAADSVGLATARVRVNYHAPSGLLCLWDRKTRKAIYWICRACDLPFWEIASPFRILFHWWAQSWGGQVAHAAAVGVNGNGVLLVGKSGSGKSTAALACLRQGLEFAGDDYVLLTAAPVPTAHSLYSSTKLHAATLARYFPEWVAHVGARVGPESKCVLYGRDLPGVHRQTHLELGAILTLQITTDAIPTLQPAPPGEAWLALVPSTVFQLPDARETTLAFFSAFTRNLPSFRLTTGRDLPRLPEAIRAFLVSNAPFRREMGSCPNC
jgi:hypothetical protein